MYVAEGDGGDARGRLDAPAALQRLQGPGAEQTQRLSVQLSQVTVRHGQTLNARTAAILQPGNRTEKSHEDDFRAVCAGMSRPHSEYPGISGSSYTGLYE